MENRRLTVVACNEKLDKNTAWLSQTFVLLPAWLSRFTAKNKAIFDLQN